MIDKVFSSVVALVVAFLRSATAVWFDNFRRAEFTATAIATYTGAYNYLLSLGLAPDRAQVAAGVFTAVVSIAYMRNPKTVAWGTETAKGEATGQSEQVKGEVTGDA